jgi:hypothetical protein
MHFTKDGKFISETDCKKWFDRLCKCGHGYGIHYGSNEGCMRMDHNGDFCSCKKFKLRKSTGY